MTDANKGLHPDGPVEGRCNGRVSTKCPASKLLLHSCLGSSTLSPPSKSNYQARRRECECLLPSAAADSDSEACEDRKKKEGRKAKDDVPAEVRPAEEPSFDFVAYAVAAARQAGGATPPEQLEPGPNNGVTSGAQVLQKKQMGMVV